MLKLAIVEIHFGTGVRSIVVSMHLKSLLLVFSLLFTAQAYADVVDDYQQERSRLLSLKFADRYNALQQSKVFNTDTPLGKYFYNTVHTNTSKFADYYTLSEEEQASLKATFPEMYYEYRISAIMDSEDNAEPLLKELSEIKSIAQAQDWKRIARFATSVEVTIQISSGYFYSAILNMQDMIDEAPDMTHMETVYDYPLVLLYKDMAEAYYQAGNYPEADLMCGKYADYLPDDLYTQLEGKLCQVRTQVKMHDYKSALQVSMNVLQVAQHNDLDLLTVSAYTFISKIYLEMGDTALGRSYAQQGIEFCDTSDHEVPADYYYLYYLLAEASVDESNPEQASHYLSLMRDIRGAPNDNAVLNAKEWEIEAGIAKLQGDYKRLATVYEAMLEQRDDPAKIRAESQDFASLVEHMGIQHDSYLQVTSELNQARSKNMTTVALFTTALSAVGFIAFWRIFRQKQKIESFSRLDHLTSISNRWHATEMMNRRISAMARQNDVSCVALIDIDHFKDINDQYGHDGGDATLKYIAKLFKYQLRRKDVFGRYGGEEFVLMLDGTGLDDAIQKIEGLRRILLHVDIPEIPDLTSLRFSCGVLEVSKKADVKAVITQCDELLYQAKRSGRNKTCHGRYTAA